MESRQSVKITAGLFVLVGLVLFAAFAFFVGERGRYFGAQHTLRAYFPSVAGLREGSTVRVAGVAVGRVSRIRLPGPSEKEVLVELDVSDETIESVRRDSVAQLQTLGFLGDKFIEISVGSPAEPRVADGGVLQTEPATDVAALIGQGRRVLGQAEGLAASLERGGGALPWLIHDPQSKRLVADALGALRTMVALLERGDGALPWLVSDPQSKRLVAETLGSIRAATAALDRGQGALPWLIHDPASRRLAGDLGRAAEALAALATDAKNGRGLAHALIYDPKGGELLAKASQAIENIRRLAAALQDGDGALPALLFDPRSRKLVNHLEAALRNLDTITGKIARGEGTVGALVADPTLYEDLATLLQGAERSRILRWVIRRTLDSGRKAQARDDRGGDR